MTKLFSDKITSIIQQTSELTVRVNELEQKSTSEHINAVNQQLNELTIRVGECEQLLNSLEARLTKLINEITPVLTSHANVLTELTKRLTC